jgi:flavin reductase (DIM6/NTAB) family NADH-FMN oxidoreductase RutF
MTTMDTTAVGKIPSGLYIVTTHYNAISEGFLGSWIQQASFSPLVLTVAVKAGRTCHAAIRDGGKFVINIVSNENKQILKPFWSPKGGNPFESLEHQVTAHGVVLNGALGWMACQRLSMASPGDHDIIFAEVVESAMLQPESSPMTHIRKSGLDY